jgi:hypothetical protein
MTPIRVTDHAILRYLERAYGLDIELVCRHIANRCATAAQLEAIGVTVEGVKFVLAASVSETAVITALKPHWPTRPGGTQP